MAGSSCRGQCTIEVMLAFSCVFVVFLLFFAEVERELRRYLEPVQLSREVRR